MTNYILINRKMENSPELKTSTIANTNNLSFSPPQTPVSAGIQKNKTSTPETAEARASNLIDQIDEEVPKLDEISNPKSEPENVNIAVWKLDENSNLKQSENENEDVFTPSKNLVLNEEAKFIEVPLETNLETEGNFVDGSPS